MRIGRKKGLLSQAAITLALSLVALFCLTPMLHILAKSLSSESAVGMGKVSLWPVGWDLRAYAYVVTAHFVRPFMIQAIVTVSGTLLSVTLLFLMAYPLTRPGLIGKKPVLMLVIFTMVFNPGIIPNYLLISSLRLTNNLLSVILPGAFSGFSLMIVRSYMQTLPDSLVESAQVEGAGHWAILIRIILPLCVPVLATMVLFAAVGYWNSYFDAMIYLTRPSLKTLQVYLREVVSNVQNIATSYVADTDSTIARSPQTIKAAAIITTTLPILLLYPMLQKYYIQGMTVGSIKE